MMTLGITPQTQGHRDGDLLSAAAKMFTQRNFIDEMRRTREVGSTTRVLPLNLKFLTACTLGPGKVEQAPII